MFKDKSLSFKAITHAPREQIFPAAPHHIGTVTFSLWTNLWNPQQKFYKLTAKDLASDPRPVITWMILEGNVTPVNVSGNLPLPGLF